jgi:hypothetical protein
VAQLNISKPVGDVQADGSRSPNMFDDALIVQYLLNRSPGPGKPNPPLQEDGAVTAQVIAAIRDYESSRGAVDGRIDPGDSTMVALNAIPLSEFEGVTDVFERRSIILRVNPQWNFTRGAYKTLTDRGRSLTYDPSTTWLPNDLKTRILTILNTILDPAQVPSNTWGVSTLDSYHWHLGLWSGVENQRISTASENWFSDAKIHLINGLTNLQDPFLKKSLKTSFPGDIPGYRAAHAAWLQTPAVKSRLEAYAILPEAVIVHHTFEEVDWRPNMLTGDPRRARMVGKSGAIQIPKYLSTAELNEASDFHRREFLCQGMPQINLLIDKSGVIHPILGLLADLSVVTGLPSDALLARNRFKDVRIPF